MYTIKLKDYIMEEVQEKVWHFSDPKYFSEDKSHDIYTSSGHDYQGCGITDLNLSFIDNPQIIVFRTKANELIEHPHIDGTGIKNKPHEFAINVPLKGGSKGDFIFYHEGIEVGYERLQHWKKKYTYHTWRPYDNSVLTEAERIQLDGAYMINPSVFHHVDNRGNNEDRYICSIRFQDKFPTWDEALIYFGDLIDG
jgi:hypothetical protein